MLDVLRRVIQEVNTAKDLDSALDIIVDRIQSTMNTEVCSIYLLDESRKQYVFMATRGLNEALVGKVALEIDEGLVGLVGERAEPVNLHNAKKHPRYLHITDLREENFSSFLGVPIIHHRKVWVSLLSSKLAGDVLLRVKKLFLLRFPLNCQVL